MTSSGRTRVVHVITKLAVGGAQHTVLDLCRTLPRDRFEHVVLAGPEVDDEGTLRPDFEAAGVPVVIVGSLRNAPHPARDLVALFALRRQLRRLRPDVVHTHSSKAGALGRVAARLARSRSVVHTVHGWSFHVGMRRWTLALAVLAERLLARCCHALVVVSEADIAKGRSRGIGRPRQYVLIRNGIDLDAFAPRSEQSPPRPWTAGTVGRLSPPKDPLGMLDAWARVVAVRPDARFVWAGDGPMRAAVEARRAELGLEGSFELVGLQRDIPAVLAGFDAFVLSSRWEGLPRTVTEAMAAGVPVVATAVDGVVDVLDDGRTGLAVPPADPGALAGAIVRLHDDPALGRHLAEGGRQRSQRFDPQSIAAATARLYDALVTGEAPVGQHRRRRVTHVITGLGLGGAENQLLRLVRATDPRATVHEVVSLSGEGPLADELRREGVVVRSLSSGRRHPFRLVVELRRAVRAGAPDVVQTWLYHADLLGGLVARSLRVPVVWNIRQQAIGAVKRPARMAALASARLSGHVPAAVLVNSDAGLEGHADLGYCRDRLCRVHNVVDLDRFRPEATARRHLRADLGLDDHHVVVGHVARLDPQKDHRTFLAAAARIVRDHPEFRFVLCGDGVDGTASELVAVIEELRLTRVVRLLGRRDDVAEVTAGFDVAVSSAAWGEGASNALLEALACGVPCVATDTGDARAIVGEAGVIVPCQAEDAMAHAVVLAATSPAIRAAVGARRAWLEQFAPAAVAAAYEGIYADVVGH